MIRLAFILSWLGSAALTASGQSVATDTTLSKAAARYAIARHEVLSNDLEHLYNGPEYIGYDRRMEGHAFYLADSLMPGRIAYETGLFAVPLLYDIVKDKLVVVHPSGYRMALHSDRIQHFSVNNHTFIRLDSTGQGIPGGFYDLIYDGPTRLLVRRTKQILNTQTTVSSLSSNGMYGQFDAKTKYYVRRNGAYIQVKNRRALLSALADHRKELAAFARKQRLSFRPSPEAAFATLVQQYDALANSL